MSSKGMTLLELKMRAKAKEDDEKAKAARKRNIIVLVLDYFSKNGYIDSMDRLSLESGVSLTKWQAADNIDLPSVMQEFEAFYEMKYGRAPRLVRPATGEDIEEIEKATKSRGKRTAVPLPPLPAGMGSTPSAIPAGYRSSYSSVDGYQGNSMDSSTGMTNSGGGSIESQSVGGGGSYSGVARSASTKDKRAGAHSAKGTKVQTNSNGESAIAMTNNATSTAAHPPTTSANTATSGSGRGKGEKKLIGRQASLSTNVEFSVQGSGASSASSSAGSSSTSVGLMLTSPPSASHHGKSNSISSFPVGGGGSSKHRPSPSPSRIDSPPIDYDGAVTDGKDHSSYYETRILKPMPEYADSQFRELAHIITRDIFSDNPNVRWHDIAELDEAKQLLKEAVVMPLKFPQFFTGLLSPWKGILLYGPPGTGKTMLARAVATECQTTFFNISASSIVSKFRGDSEKLVRVLFELARYHAPSTIFIDEIDSIMGSRDAAGEHEGSRRMKTELLIQLDGLSSTTSAPVFVLAASNLPWDLDIALLRRLEKRILVPLPTERARQTMIRGHLTDGERASGLDYVDLARKTEGYSGSDIALLCKEAAMRPVRRLMAQLLTVEAPDTDVTAEVKLDPVVENDVKQALACTRPSAQSKFLSKYVDWHAAYGAGMHDVTLDAPQE